MIDAVAIMGPTGVGKSSIAVKLAARFNGEVISIDSRQAYKYLDIGTAKPTKEKMEGIPHHLLDVLEPSEKNNAERFSRMAIQKIDELRAKEKLPILAGGTGLYFKAIFEGLFSVDLNEEERKKFESSVRSLTTEKLRKRLKDVDQESYSRINANDRYRVIRALEVYELTGIPLSEHFRRQGQSKERTRDLSFLKIGLDMSREKLYRRINERTLKMFEAGWIEEVKDLIAKGFDTSWPAMKTLGYPEIIEYLQGRFTKDELIERVSRLTRQYAKRQLTWFRKERDVIWFQADDEDLIEKLSRLIYERLAG